VDAASELAARRYNGMQSAFADINGGKLRNRSAIGIYPNETGPPGAGIFLVAKLAYRTAEV